MPCYTRGAEQTLMKTKEFSQRRQWACFALAAFIVTTVLIAAGDPEESTSLERLNALVKDPDSPIRFDKKLNEYYIVFNSKEKGGHVRMPLAFCPFTGTKLPESKRAAAFAKPDQKQVAEISKRLDGIK